ncbi:unnamed protein product [Adineta steineri]|uniref:Endonuclease/exonuclease/phosphatase domain-containing protein n=1 Tax=Adineta steineri TaxID=433720 RepID=A0A819ALX4_9BILA|nr:unnamed protein product [Adineta steineri]
MLLLARLFNIYSIRHSSKTREYFANLKKFYRSTTLDLFMASANRTCFVFDKEESTKILIQMTYDIPSTTIRRKFNLLRSVDESVLQTIRRLTANIERSSKKVNFKANKRREKQQNNSSNTSTEQDSIIIQLLDSNNEIIDENQTNKQAWLNCRKLLINEQTYDVEYNAPAVIKFRFPDIIMTNTIVTALVDLDYGDWEHSLFDWYVTDEIKIQANDENEDTIDDSQWIHVHRGPFCTFHDEHVNKYVRLSCLPRNNSLRQGMQAVHVSKARIIPCPIDLPMNTRHQLTQDYFPIDSNDLRLVSYNILANGYASSTGAGEIIYPYCPQDYLEHDYRKPLLLREILGYHADIISIQECDTRFFERELSLVLKEHGYLGDMKIKSENVQEGEAIFYRKDRFTAINSHSIRIGDYLRDSEHLEHIRQRCVLVPEINTHLLERNTILQVLALQPQGQINEIFLICNTHLYFHPTADIVRCFQVVVSCEHIKEVKQFYEQQNKNVSIIWSGDFNANVTSLAFQFLFSGCLLTDTNHRSYNEDYATLIKDFNHNSSLELSTYSQYAYTNYMLNFHGVIDHIFFEGKKFQFKRCIPMPTHEEVTEFSALPNCKLPSDHLAVVIELEMIK